MKLSVTIILLTLIVSACGQSSHDPGANKPAGDTGGGGGGNGGNLGGGTPITFATVKAQIFTPHCVGCHRSFEDYAKVTLSLNSIQDAVLANRMPKRAPLSDELKALLTEWIDQGAPEGG